MNPFGRDGHLHDLGVELLLAGELARPDDVAASVAAHLGACPACAARVSAARTDDALPVPPRARRSPAAIRWAPALGAALALAAGLALWLRYPPGEGPARPPFVAKGPGLALEVYADRGATAEQLGWNSAVHPGERLGFRVRTGVAGRVLVVGVDAAGAVYPCWPADGVAATLEPRDRPDDLPAAVRLDDTPGAERLVAIRCAQPFSVDGIAGTLVDRASSVGPDARLAEIVPGCAQDEVRVEREPR